MSDEEELLVAASRRVGAVLHGKYHIDAVLGVGGMATVYAATHRNRKRFAIKILHPEYSVRRDVRARFVREGYVANSVGHPGAVVVIDDDVDETGSAFLVMELLDGVTVDHLLTPERKPVPVREALAITHQLLDVLQAAHENSVIHRDVKPANLFVLKTGEVKVVDFGIARLREADAGIKSTRTGAMLGTPAFMAPEQALAVPGEIDARTDIWAAGATLFIMLTARFVHEGENARQVMISAATKPAPSPASIVPDLPPSVVELVSRALMFEKAERFATAAVMRDAVLAAHRELFGEPDRDHLRALVARTHVLLGSSPTEASPMEFGGGATRATDVAMSAGLATTTARPVSTGGKDAPGRSRVAFALLAGAGAVAAVGLVVRPWAETAPPEPAARPPAPAPTALQPAPPTSTAASLPSPTVVEGTTRTVAAEPQQPVAPAAAAPSARRRLDTKPASRVDGAAPPAAPSARTETGASGAPRPANPLELKLQ